MILVTIVTIYIDLDIDMLVKTILVTRNYQR
jgi:hypothetical protein